MLQKSKALYSISSQKRESIIIFITKLYYQQNRLPTHLSFYHVQINVLNVRNKKRNKKTICERTLNRITSSILAVLPSLTQV